MIIEVDNTTEKIIGSLQDAIEGSINRVHDDQASIVKEISSLKNIISNEEVLDSLHGVDKSICGLSDKIEAIERSSEDVAVVLDKVITQLKTISADEREGSEKVLVAIGDLSNKYDELKNTIQIIVEKNKSLEAYIQGIDGSVKELEKSTREITHSLDILVASNEERIKKDQIEAEKTDRIMEYLKKPGIARFFSGMKGE